jgi:hypothetical protein
MERKMLYGIKERAERLARERQEAGVAEDAVPVGSDLGNQSP